MKLTDLFVRRPVLAVVVNLVILIAGLQAVRSLSVRQYPKSDIAVVKVTTAYIGANADLVRGYIDRGRLGHKSGGGFYDYPDPAFRRAEFLDPEEGMNSIRMDTDNTD